VIHPLLGSVPGTIYPVFRKPRREEATLIEALLAVLAIAVVVLAVVIFRGLRTSDDSDSAELELHMTNIMQAQQSLAGKVDMVSTQQVESSRQLTESFGKSQKESLSPTGSAGSKRR